MPTTGPSQLSDGSIAGIRARAAVNYGKRATNSRIDGTIAELRLIIPQAGGTIARPRRTLLTNDTSDYLQV